MNGITKQTRRQSYDGIRTRSGERCKLILETLGNRSMTVEEITDELVAAGHLKYYDRNFVAPRLTELKGAGVLEVVGKKPSKRTGKNTAGKPLDLKNRGKQAPAAAAELVPGRDYDPDTGEVYETAGQPTDDRQTTGGRNNMKVVKIAPAKEA